MAKVQGKAPYFKGEAVVDGQFKTISLDDYKGMLLLWLLAVLTFSGKYLVLFFYPFDFTFVCPTEIIAFSDRAEVCNKLEVNKVSHSSIGVPQARCRSCCVFGGLRVLPFGMDQHSTPRRWSWLYEHPTSG